MSVPAFSPSQEPPPWGFLEWAVTGLSTVVASALAFVWRSLARLGLLESLVGQQRRDIDALSASVDAAMLRLAERFGQLHDDHFRLRETMGALSTRDDLHALEVRFGERLDTLAARLDRALDSHIA